MPERRFAILKYSGKTPALATCELCHLKFFTPSELKHKPVDAEMYLREKFEWQLRSDGIAYIPFVRLVARSGLTLTDCDISTVFDDEIVIASFHMDPICRLGGTEYWQDKALNQRIENGLVLSRDQTVEGFILAKGLRRIPREYREFKIVFSAQFGDEFSATGMFSVLRQQVQRDNARVAKGGGLYGPDATGRPREPSIEEQMRRRFLESLAQQRRVPR